MGRSSADAETPYTDFWVEDRDGQTRAVFDRLTLAESSLLSHLLYPDSEYADLLYCDVSAVAGGERPSATYCNEYFNAVCTMSGLEIEANQVRAGGGAVRLKIPIDDAKYLLLKWKFECDRRESDATIWQRAEAGAGRNSSRK